MPAIRASAPPTTSWSFTPPAAARPTPSACARAAWWWRPATEADGVATNGMSLFARDGANANSALLVGVTPADFGGDHPLAGMEFQRTGNERPLPLGGSNYGAGAAGRGFARRPRVRGASAMCSPPTVPAGRLARPGRLPARLRDRDPAPGVAFLRQAAAGLRPRRRGADRGGDPQFIAGAHRARR